jgi:hypothetical protein
LRAPGQSTIEKLLQVPEFTELAETLVEVTEREGFEPPDACASPVFKTGAFSHSATSPHTYYRISGSGSLILPALPDPDHLSNVIGHPALMRVVPAAAPTANGPAAPPVRRNCSLRNGANG